MINKSLGAAALAGVILTMFFSGCHETAASPIVALKEYTGKENTVAANKNLTIEDQVLAPKHYQNTIYDNDGLNIVIDADVILPKAEGFKIKKADVRKWGENEIKQIRQILGKGNKYRTVSGMNESYLEVSVDGKEYLLTQLKAADDVLGVERLCFEQTDMDLQPITTPKKKLKKDAQMLITELGLTDYVLGGEESTSEEVYQQSEEYTEPTEFRYGYTLYYTRKIDGIPITYTSQQTGLSQKVEGSLEMSEEMSGEMSDSQTDIKGDYGMESDAYNSQEEFLSVTYNHAGLERFTWWNPYNITDISDEYVFLLPFSEIQQIFESVMLSSYNGSAMMTDITVNQVRLGYMRVIDPQNEDSAKLVPVWDFFGSILYSDVLYDGTINAFGNQDVPYNSLLTLNAMDGTVIDRTVGY